MILENISPIGYNTVMSQNVSTLPEIDLAALCQDLEAVTGYTPTQMAELLGATLTAYCRWRTNERTPNGEYTAKLLYLFRSLEKQGEKISLKLK